MAIAKMKKISMFTLEKYRNAFTSALMNLGVLHITFKTVEHDEKLQKTEEILKEFEECKEILNTTMKKTKIVQEHADLKECRIVVKKILAIKETEAKLKENMDAISFEIAKYEHLGDFDLNLVEELQKMGFVIHIYDFSTEEILDLPKNDRYIVLANKSGGATLAFVNKTFSDKEEVKMPLKRLSEMRKDLENLEAKSLETESKILEFVKFYKSIEKSIAKTEEEVSFIKVLNNLERTENLEDMIQVDGFVPEDLLEKTIKFAKENSFGLLVGEIDDYNEVPTLLKNKGLGKLIKPVLDFIDVLPGYNEIDISFFFTLFFTLFFGIIIGDAGYGSIFLVLSLFFLVKSKFSVESLLFTLLSTWTIVWGAMTGTWFGMSENALKNIPFLYNLIVEPISNFNPKSGVLIQTMCFYIAAIHLTLAHLLAFFKKIREKPYIHALADLGSIGIVLGLFNLILVLVIKENFVFYKFSLWGIIGGFISLILFSKQGEGKSFISGVLEALSNIIGIILGVIGVFSDIVSYIRLFAVGVSGYFMASSFNGMILGGGLNPISFIALGFAHALVIILAILSVVVHGVRLNTLEFSTHVGNEWSGIRYDPFRKKSI